MRRFLFVLIALTIVASASTSLASTDCEKWLAEYKKELAHKTSVQRALDARERARRYARRKVAMLIKPAVAPTPHPLRVSSTRPHLTPAQMLKRFDLLCGDLPIDAPNQVLSGRMSPDEFISEMAMGGPVDAEQLPAEDTLIASEDTPPYTPPGLTSSSPGGEPVWPIYGPVPGGGGGGFITPVVPPVTPPPVAPVPEPGSILMVATGIAGAAGALRRRFAQA